MSSPLPIAEPDDADDFSSEEYSDVPKWHRKILDELMAKYEAEGFHGTPLEEFERELKELRQTLTKQ